MPWNVAPPRRVNSVICRRGRTITSPKSKSSNGRQYGYVWANSYAEMANQIPPTPFSRKLKCLKLCDLTRLVLKPGLSGFEHMLFTMVYCLHGWSFAEHIFLLSYKHMVGNWHAITAIANIYWVLICVRMSSECFICANSFNPYWHLTGIFIDEEAEVEII